MRRYIVVRGCSSSMLEIEVNDLIRKGYEPIGGATITTDRLDNTVFIQAVYLTERTNECC